MLMVAVGKSTCPSQPPAQLSATSKLIPWQLAWSHSSAHSMLLISSSTQNELPAQLKQAQHCALARPETKRSAAASASQRKRPLRKSRRSAGSNPRGMRLPSPWTRDALCSRLVPHQPPIVDRTVPHGRYDPDEDGRR